MNRIVLQFAGLWLGASGVLGYAQWNAPSFGNTYRVAQADLPLPPAPMPEEADLPEMEIPRDADASVLSGEVGGAVEAGAPVPAGPIGYGGPLYGGAAYGGPAYGGTFGGDACCEPVDPCAVGLWDGYWSAKRPWCMKGHCGHCGGGLLPQLNWAGGCCAHRACFGAGVGHGGHGGFGLLGRGLHGHGVACCEEEVVADCGCEPCADSCCGHGGFLPRLNWVGGCCAHRACFGGGVGVGHGHGFLGGHGHHGIGVTMDAGCSDCGN